MDSTYLTSSEFWESDTCHVMVNDRDMAAVAQSEIIRPWCQNRAQLSGHLLFSTSGSTGCGKWVALSREALLASARAVNEHLNVSTADRWLLALPTFHVGGMGIVARAHLASCGLSLYQGVWDTEEFHKALGGGVTLTSLVPTQLRDLVAEGLCAPDCLRAVLIGGGALDEGVYEKAVALGWPVIETYGMTEAASQIATASVSDRILSVLPCWQTRTDASGVLAIKGTPLLTSYLSVVDGEVFSESPLSDGWLTTSDRVELEEGILVFKGRSDRCVKILGELVDLAVVEKQLQSLLPEENVAVVALPDERKGARLVVCAEFSSGTLEQQGIIDNYNLTCIPVARVGGLQLIHEFPRSALGKIRYQELAEALQCDKLKEK